MKTWIQVHILLFATLSSLGAIAQKPGVGSELTPIVRPTRPTPTRTFEVNGETAFRFAIQHGFKFYPEFISMPGRPASSDHDGSAITGVRCAASIRNYDCNGISQMLRGTYATIHLPCKMFIRQGNPRWEPVTCSNMFHFFRGKNLNPGWTLENVTIGPSQDASWVTSRDRTNPHIKMRITRSTDPNRSAYAIIHKLILRGPSNGKWQDAFVSRKAWPYW